jgi:M6 family metalloprotease-like protein
MAVGLALAAAVAIVSATSATAQAAQATLQTLTGNVIELIGQHGKAADHLKPAILARLQNIATQRHQQLATAIESDPGAVLQVALPGALRQRAPASVRNFIEEQVDMDGELEVLHEDRDQGSRFVYKLKAFGLDYSLNFRKNPPTQMTSGTRVRVHGVRVNTALALDSGASVQAAAAPIAPNTFGQQNTIVILVNFRNNTTQPYDTTAAGAVFNTTSNFFLENSYQQAYLNTTIRGWYTLDMDAPYYVTNADGTKTYYCDYSSIASKADAAATGAGVTLSNYTRKVYAFPQVSGCTWWGLGSVGGNPSRAWINGSLQLRVAAHEMGHNLGLWHSHSLDCGAAVIGGTCTSSDYGDVLDVMGSSSYHFNAFQKERLGWLNYGASPPITSASSNGSYPIYPLETLGNNPKAVKILKSINTSTGKSAYYYAECRQPIGFDAGLSSNANVLNGLVIHTGDEASGNSSYLLDMTPATASWNDPALVTGLSFTDSASGVTLTSEVPCSNTLNGNVGVTIGPIACVRANPDLTISPTANQSIAAGGSATYALSLKNNDNSGCATGNFNLTVAPPSGWSAKLGSAALAIAPGGTASTSLTVTAPSGAADGIYQTSATASNAAAPNYTDTATGGAVVYTVSSVSVTVATDKTTYSRNQNVTISTTVNVNGSPAANMPVNLSITKPTGATSNVSVTTAANGVASYKFRLNRKDPAGTWQAQGSSSTGGVSGSGSKSFIVQ